MADYRTIHSKIWEDDWFCSLSAEALKNTLIYVIINTVESSRYGQRSLDKNAVSRDGSFLHTRRLLWQKSKQ